VRIVIRRAPRLFDAASRLPVVTHSDCFRSGGGSSNYGNYLFGCKWSPDATCVLACSGESSMSVMEVERWTAYPGTSARIPDAGAAAVTCRAAETVFDYCWFPKMCSALPESCCFATTSRDQPLQLWDAYTGGRFASYAGYGDSEELDTATSVAFGHDCSRIYGGYNGLVRVWDVAVPGRSCRKVQLFRRAHAVASGQKGLVSSIDSSVHGVAVGSFAGTVAVYDDNIGGGTILGVHGSGGSGGGQSNGVTQVKWSARCSQIVSAGRRDEALSVWDVRMGAGQPLMTLPRRSCTNQRVLFDVSSCGRYIATPHHARDAAAAHSIRVYDLVTGMLETEVALPKAAFPNAVGLYAGPQQLPHCLSRSPAGTPLRPCLQCPRAKGCTSCRRAAAAEAVAAAMTRSRYKNAVRGSWRRRCWPTEAASPESRQLSRLLFVPPAALDEAGAREVAFFLNKQMRATDFRIGTFGLEGCVLRVEHLVWRGVYCALLSASCEPHFINFATLHFLALA
jgi:hypothetical protein